MADIQLTNQPHRSAKARHPQRPARTRGERITRTLILASFLMIVIAPTAVWAWYLWARAQDQYVSTVSFSVRKEESDPTLNLLGGLTQLTGSTSASDPDILYDFLHSQDIVATINADLDLVSRFSRFHEIDPVFSYDASGSLEDLTDYWREQVDVDYDSSSKLITLSVMAFSPEDARDIAQAAFDESSRTINRLSDIARDDATRFSRGELQKAQERLTRARQEMTSFRMRTQIVDPEADLAGQMEVLSGLQSQLVEAMVAQDTLRETAREDDPRVAQGQRRINAIQAQIAAERAKFGESDQGPNGESYAQLVAEYEELATDLEFAETTYRAAQASYESALAEGQRQSRYLAAHIAPRTAESSVLPDRPMLVLKAFGMLLLGWGVLLLCYYSIRERR
ncbi:capsular polysaccharide transport system permease protein [Paracoccus isoporae]|uniref:Capsular polysaccharide transport system permease protein n=1 Tax=Paracoccus isoporae TaxID=591205 RepID=A0A1G7CT71_9RHOB|nr:capsule biosynthesis protein [Paracoccus isoporae]SDE41960.1 capsular polysaccharide transport system permease protein [Paracoccus isoporae]